MEGGLNSTIINETWSSITQQGQRQQMLAFDSTHDYSIPVESCACSKPSLIERAPGGVFNKNGRWFVCLHYQQPYSNVIVTNNK